MGTRGLTMVISKEKTKVAQYGQWDHHPGGVGTDILHFLNNCDFEKFAKKLEKYSFLEDELEAKEIEKKMDPFSHDEIEIKYPEFHRNTGGNILPLIYDGEFTKTRWNPKTNKDEHITPKLKNRTKLQDSSYFAADSLFCEWAYVVDLDKRTFEVYRGFNKSPTTEEDRFHSLVKTPPKNGYYPVKLVKSYSLDNLPEYFSFLSDTEPKNEEEED